MTVLATAKNWTKEQVERRTQLPWSDEGKDLPAWVAQQEEFLAAGHRVSFWCLVDLLDLWMGHSLSAPSDADRRNRGIYALMRGVLKVRLVVQSNTERQVYSRYEAPRRTSWYALGDGITIAKLKEGVQVVDARLRLGENTLADQLVHKHNERGTR